jgi:carboxymethylenebutenolidase
MQSMNDIKQDMESLLPATSLSGALDRRDFMKTAIGTSFAAAALPVCAQSMIKTDAAGLAAGGIAINANGREVPAYRAQPEGKTGLPVVLVISEIFGVHEHIADVARRFARLGYLAIAPDLFIRQGDPNAYPSVADLMAKLVRKVPDAQVMADLDACVAWAAGNGGDTRRLGMTGFCWGGRITWLYAAHNPQLKAGVAWYGRLVGDRTPETPRHPVDIAGNLKAPVLGLYGGRDAGIPLSAVEEMKAALKEAGQPSEFVIYPDAGHAFHADYRPSFSEADARDGWQRCLEWFRRHGVA